MASSSSQNEKKLDTELESFRQQWISDLRTRTDHHESGPHQQPVHAAAGSSRLPLHGPPPSSILHKHVPPNQEEDEEDQDQDQDQDDGYIPKRSFDANEPPSPTSLRSTHDIQHGRSGKKKLVSALDHFEEAMFKEGQGNMGDSLKLYREAYRLDTGVDRRYREKYFPQTKTAPRPTSPTSTRTAAATNAGTGATHPPLTASQPTKADDAAPSQPLPIGELIASFSHLKIEPVPPPVQGMPQTPCPLADLPDEILIHILRDVAIADVGDFSRLSRVCKRLAYLVATEKRIWRRIVLGPEVGFEAMLYRYEKSIEWDELPEDEKEGPQIIDDVVVSPEELAQRRRDEALAYTLSLTPSVYPTWRKHFQLRPRIRFNGCYISTVNYVRTGQASTNQTTWNTPIHIVTYYRYLRFFRDGTLISLLTTTDPVDVVPHLTRENLNLHRAATQPHLPSAVMALALRGRWRLSSAADQEHQDVMNRPAEGSGNRNRNPDPEGDLYIETEGVGTKYMYRMDLSLRSAGKGARNNKLVWRGFYSYNKLTDDWGEFVLKNDKPYFFSRVKSYGFGL